ncbi:hypothetical protein D3C87_2063170 [compost metagenome]
MKRIRTGATVQTISIVVLWLVRDGVGFLSARNFTATMINRARTKSVTGTMNQSVYFSNQLIWCMISVAGA